MCNIFYSFILWIRWKICNGMKLFCFYLSLSVTPFYWPRESHFSFVSYRTKTDMLTDRRTHKKSTHRQTEGHEDALIDWQTDIHYEKQTDRKWTVRQTFILLKFFLKICFNILLFMLNNFFYQNVINLLFNIIYC